EVRMRGEIAIVLADEGGHPRTELRHERQQLLLAHVRRGSGGHMHDAHARHPLLCFGLRGMITAREDVYRIAETREVSRDLRDVDVLSAAIDTAGRSERRCMLAD